MQFTFDIGEKVDILTQRELRDSLAEDRAIRGALVGVKTVEAFFNIGQIGATTQTFTTPPSMVSGGEAWAVMNIGAELSAAVGLRVYKGQPPGSAAGTGLGRPVAALTSGLVTAQGFSKGQITLKGGDLLTFNAAGAGNLLSIFISAISIPAERFGELLV